MRGRINNRKRLGACRTLLQLGGRLVSVRGAGVKMWHSWVCKDVGGMHAMAFWGLRGLKRGVRDTTTPAQVGSLAVKTKSTTRAPWSASIGFQLLILRGALTHIIYLATYGTRHSAASTYNRSSVCRSALACRWMCRARSSSRRTASCRVCGQLRRASTACPGRRVWPAGTRGLAGLRTPS